jgi:hypothetical protein
MKVIGMMKKIVVNNVLKEYNYNKKGEGWCILNKVTENLLIMKVYIKVILNIIWNVVKEYKFMQLVQYMKVNGL